MHWKTPSAWLRHVQALRKYHHTPRRYGELLEACRQRAPRTIVEIGVHDGKRATEMINAAAIARPPQEISYHGFDLFEGLTDELLSTELSKRPPPEEEVVERLLTTGASIHLYKGYSDQTLPTFKGRADFVFVDGGHAVETIRSDWENVERFMNDETVVIFDDYYVKSQITDKFGCNRVVESLGNHSWRRMKQVDHFPHKDLRVSLVEVRKI